MAGLAAVLTNLKAMQVAATVKVEEVVIKIEEVFTGPVPGNATPTLPWVQNLWTFPEQEDHLAQNVHTYQINSQWFISEAMPADTDTWLAITNLWEHFLNLWIADERCKNGGAATILSGMPPTAGAVLLERGGKDYLGLDVIWTVQIERDSSA